MSEHDVIITSAFKGNTQLINGFQLPPQNNKQQYRQKQAQQQCDLISWVVFNFFIPYMFRTKKYGRRAEC